MDLRRVWISAARRAFGNGENSLNVRKSEEASLAVARHLGVFAGFEAPADGVGMDAQKRAEIPRPMMTFFWNS
jgi:hypothetical protein